ncbi:MAG TPA: methionine--tRNA ligase [Polyangia bacterium]|nr:methionine--tRNA ligase [Polyangia bacterium]
MSKFFITTPIYYVNALPHLGTFYSTVVADALARHHRARFGKESTFFLTGLDEHGVKIERIAREKGIDPKTYCDGVAAEFKRIWARAGISFDRFIRTTDPDHLVAVHEMWRRMVARGDIYTADYDGLYCVGCEDWKTEDEVITENGEKICPIHRRPVERVREKNYFFRLSRYADQLLEWYETGAVRPESRRNEVAEFVRRGLRDISVSRMTVKWGIPVPDDPQHVIYVWIDALTNYLTALGGPGAVEAGHDNGAFWSASHHLIAKDILRFHAVYWPAILWSAGLPPPKHVFCHGYLTVKGQKISKSIPATRVDPSAIGDELGIDPLRYFVLREYTLGGDGDFTYEALFQRYESDLGNDLGNLLNRTVSMAHRYFGGTVHQVQAVGTLEEARGATALLRQAEGAWDDFSPSRALETTWQLVRSFNGYIESKKPWAMAKDENRKYELETMLANCCEALRWAALMVAPAMPAASKEILRQLGRSVDEGTWPTEWRWPGSTLTEPQPIFPRFEPDKQAALINKWMPAEAPAAEAPKPAAEPAAAPTEITLDDFAKIDLRVAKVIACERVPKADKLLKLTLDVGSEQRTVVSGIATAYSPEQMVGRAVIYLANLKPAKIRGVLSQGMILAAGDADVLGLSTLDRDVAPGTKVR